MMVRSGQTKTQNIRNAKDRLRNLSFVGHGANKIWCQLRRARHDRFTCPHCAARATPRHRRYATPPSPTSSLTLRDHTPSTPTRH
jgi:hypothetical protein